MSPYFLKDLTIIYFSDGAALKKSIKTKLYTLPNDTLVIPGHGEETKIGRNGCCYVSEILLGEEKKLNPVVRGI